MTKPMTRVHDLQNDTVTDREMNEEEYAQHLKRIEDSENEKSKAQAAQALKDSAIAKLTALGLSADEVRAIVG